MQVIHKNQKEQNRPQSQRSDNSGVEQYANQELLERYKKLIDSNMNLYDASENNKKLCVHLLGFISKLGKTERFLEYYEREEIKKNQKALNEAISTFEHSSLKGEIRNPYY